MRLVKTKNLALLIALAGFVSGCGQTRKATADNSGSAPAAAVVKVVRGNMGDHLEIASEFQPFQEVDIYA